MSTILDHMRAASERVSYPVRGPALDASAPRDGWQLHPTAPYQWAPAMRSCQGCGLAGCRHRYLLVHAEWSTHIEVGGVCGLKLLGELPTSNYLDEIKESHWWANQRWRTEADGSRVKQVNRRATVTIYPDYSWTLTYRHKTLQTAHSTSLVAALVDTRLAIQSVPEQPARPGKQRQPKAEKLYKSEEDSAF